MTEQYQEKKFTHNLEERLCVNADCKNTFTVSTKSNPKKYCSRSCAAKTNNVTTPKRKLEGTCGVCKVDIAASHKFCHIHTGSNGTGQLYERVPIIKVCKNERCQKSFYTLIKNKLFCERVCYTQWSKINLPKDIARNTICPKCSGSKTPYSVRCNLCHIEEKVQAKIDKWYMVRRF